MIKEIYHGTLKRSTEDKWGFSVDGKVDPEAIAELLVYTAMQVPIGKDVKFTVSVEVDTEG